ncbi:MAG: hypothetical protein LBR53_01585 [Deltaproteobacteria bacterium]|jgi:cell division septum initiation protein DivIVA|nr:hypothetical protein [Deltaproteobacteria bacterium]
MDDECFTTSQKKSNHENILEIFALREKLYDQYDKKARSHEYVREAEAKVAEAEARANAIVAKEKARVNAIVAKAKAKADAILAKAKAKADASVVEVKAKADVRIVEEIAKADVRVAEEKAKTKKMLIILAQNLAKKGENIAEIYEAIGVDKETISHILQFFKTD